MNLSLGIVGLPNVGKSTLFNALTKKSIPAENYPFCTIDPNVGIVPVQDDRLVEIAEVVGPEEVVPAVVEFYDIAGLVRGAHEGEGLGNEFLGHIRMTQAIIHVVRAFNSPDVTHVDDRIDPSSDKETIEMELILKDLDSVEKKQEKLEREVRGAPEKKKFLELLTLLKKGLEDGSLAIEVDHQELGDDKELNKFRKELFLLTDKEFIYVINGDWEEYDEKLTKDLRQELGIPQRFPLIPMNIKQELELALLDEEERQEFIAELGVEVQGLELLTSTGYRVLDLISFFTAGEKEVKAWTIKKGASARDAAGTIHNDFFDKFILAEVTSYQDFIDFQGWLGVKEHGKLRKEGKDYTVKDGDVMLFRHGA